MAPMISSLQPSAAEALGSDAPASRADDWATEERLAWLTARANAAREKPHQYLLLMRFLLINMIGFGLLGAAYVQGLVQKVVVADATYLSVLIFIIFLAGLAICARRIWQTSCDLNHVKSFDPLAPSRAAWYVAQLRGRDGDTRGILASAMRLKLSHRIAVVRHIAGSLVLLGLIGTVLGFIIALSGVQPEHVSDVKAISPMVSTLIAGMSTALYTTLVGSVLNVWLMVNYHLLAGGTVKLIASLLEFGEEHARS